MGGLCRHHFGRTKLACQSPGPKVVVLFFPFHGTQGAYSCHPVLCPIAAAFADLELRYAVLSCAEHLACAL